jgi:hypothetical protein
MNSIMSSWEGAHINDVVSQWGYPSSIQDFRGNKLYRWNYTKSFYVPQTSTVDGSAYENFGTTNYNATITTSGGHTLNAQCARILEVTPDGFVKKWQWEGNNCPFWEAMEYKTWRNPASIKEGE